MSALHISAMWTSYHAQAIPLYLCTHHFLSGLLLEDSGHSIKQGGAPPGGTTCSMRLPSSSSEALIGNAP